MLSILQRGRAGWRPHFFKNYMLKQARNLDVARRLLRWTAADASAMISLGGVSAAEIERALALENAASRPRRKMCRVLAKHLPAQ